MTIQNRVQLITYPDSLGGDLKSLNALLLKHFSKYFGGVHILPPFPSSGDRGFAPLTYFEIDPEFGSWEDIRQIGANLDVLVDLMVNHISRQSPYFVDYAKKGRRSAYADLFLTLNKVWPEGEFPAEDLRLIFLRRPEHPFADIVIEETGEREKVWATFGTRDWSEQIDVDVHSETARQLFRDILEHFSQKGISLVRLDAVGYVIKKPGTSCFFVEPDIYSFLNWIQKEAQAVGIELLPEVHADYALQARLAEHGFWVYNFVLPFLILHTLLSRSSRELQQHLRICPRRQFTMLDCHDGIPVQPDIEGIVDVDQAQEVVQTCIQRGANISPILSTRHQARQDFNAHQINITYYSALGQNDDAYLTARAIQFFSPGIPQVYYVGLLGGENRPEEVDRTGEQRAINRWNFSTEEVEQALKKPVVQRLLKLIRFRNEQEPFNGDFEVIETGERELQLRWEKGDQYCLLKVDLDSAQSVIEFRDETEIIIEYRP